MDKDKIVWEFDRDLDLEGDEEFSLCSGEEKE